MGRTAVQHRPACFFDRDGVIIEEVSYLADPAQVRLIPGSGEAVARLNRLGIPVVVVTNQSGVARGFFPETRVAEIHARLDELLSACGAVIDRYYYCPHHPEAADVRYRMACDCRKPRPGMLLRAAVELGLELAQSCLIGDQRSDLEAARAAGCRAVLVRTGYGAETEGNLREPGIADVPIAEDLARAIELWHPPQVGKSSIGGLLKSCEYSTES